MRTLSQKEILTTGDVAKICHVAPRTVSKWFDTGRLRGYRIPGSRDRRIPLHHLIAFMRAHGIPMDTLDGGVCRVMVLSSAVPHEHVEALRASDRYEIFTAVNGFDAGVLAQQFRPHVVVLDAGPDPREAAAICRNIKTTAQLQAAKVIVTVEEGQPGLDKRLVAQGFDACLPRPFSPAELVAAIEDVTNLIT